MNATCGIDYSGLASLTIVISMFKIVLRNSLKLSNSMQGPSLLSKTFKGTDDDMVYTVHFIDSTS